MFTKSKLYLYHPRQDNNRTTQILQLMTEKDVKSCFSIKKLISISERRDEHPFAGRNTQHIKVLSTLTKLALITIKLSAKSN